MDARSVCPGWCEGGTRDDDRLDVGEVGAQELPGAFGPLVGPVRPDMAAPDDACARALRRGRSTAGCRS